MGIVHKPIRFFVIVSAIVGLAACNTTSHNYVYSSNITEEQLLDGRSFLGSSVDESDLPDEDIFLVTPEMLDLVEASVSGLNSHSSKARELARLLFDKNKLGMTYDPSATYTADQTFAQGKGNCLAFSILYSSLAQKIGLDARFQEVDIMPEWDFTADEIYVENLHINLRVNVAGSNDLIVDIDQVNPESQLKYTMLSENHVKALYYGNVGAENLFKGRNEDAFKYFVKAIKIDPEIPIFWANLGVLYRRSGNDDFAEKAYYTALKFDAKNSAALNNLAHLYDEAGDIDRSEHFSKLVKSYQKNNPYFRFVRAQKAVKESKYQDALEHIEHAIKRKSNDPRFYVLKSEIHASLGEQRKAKEERMKAEKMTREAI